MNAFFDERTQTGTYTTAHGMPFTISPLDPEQFPQLLETCGSADAEEALESLHTITYLLIATPTAPTAPYHAPEPPLYGYIRGRNDDGILRDGWVRTLPEGYGHRIGTMLLAHTILHAAQDPTIREHHIVTIEAPILSLLERIANERDGSLMRSHPAKYILRNEDHRDLIATRAHAWLAPYQRHAP